MKNLSQKDFFSELQKRLDENKRLYKTSSPLHQSELMRFTASYLGVNPWKVMVACGFF